MCVLPKFTEERKTLLAVISLIVLVCIGTTFLVTWYPLIVIDYDYASPVGISPIPLQNGTFIIIPEGPNGNWKGWQLFRHAYSLTAYYCGYGYHIITVYLHHVNGSVIYIPEWNEGRR